MKHLTVYFLLALQGVLFSFSLSAATPQNAIAYHDGNVRFSVLTDGVIRMEWSPSGSFTDDPLFCSNPPPIYLFPSTQYKIKMLR